MTVFGYFFIALFVLYNIGEVEGTFVVAFALIASFVLELANSKK